MQMNTLKDKEYSCNINYASKSTFISLKNDEKVDQYSYIFIDCRKIKK